MTGENVDRFKPRPWGGFEVLHDAPGCKVKRLVVVPGGRLSLQRHQHRCEHWYVVQGEAHLELHGRPRILQTGESLDIPALAWHRLANLGTLDLHVIEVQTGSLLAENDIERIEDDYGRIASSAG